MILRVLGVLLLVAAGLKLHGLAIEPVGAAGFFSAPWVQMLIVEWEIALGIWLVWGVSRSLAWLAATATFLAFAAVSLWQAWVGRVTCHCLGAVHIDPWLAFVIDLVALTLLGCARGSVVGQHLSTGQQRGAIRLLLRGSCGIIVIAGMFAAAGSIGFGSLDAALAYLRGERISVRPRLLDMGRGQGGEAREATIEVRNWTGRPVRLIGGTSDCWCIVTEDLPLTIPAREGRSITVKLFFPAAASGIFNRKALLLTDDNHSPRLLLRLTGRVMQKAEQTPPRVENAQDTRQTLAQVRARWFLSSPKWGPDLQETYTQGLFSHGRASERFIPNNRAHRA